MRIGEARFMKPQWWLAALVLVLALTHIGCTCERDGGSGGGSENGLVGPIADPNGGDEIEDEAAGNGLPEFVPDGASDPVDADGDGMPEGADCDDADDALYQELDRIRGC